MKSRRIRQNFCPGGGFWWLTVYMRVLPLCALLVLTPAWGTGSPSPQSVMDRALHFADLYNWYAARPYFREAQRLFAATGAA